MNQSPGLTLTRGRPLSAGGQVRYRRTLRTWADETVSDIPLPVLRLVRHRRPPRMLPALFGLGAPRMACRGTHTKCWRRFSEGNGKLLSRVIPHLRVPGTVAGLLGCVQRWRERLCVCARTGHPSGPARPGRDGTQQPSTARHGASHPEGVLECGERASLACCSALAGMRRSACHETNCRAVREARKPAIMS